MVGQMSALRDEQLKQYILDKTGDHGIAVAKLLEELGEATDTDIAERLGEKPSHVRKVLYDLYEARIAEYYQKKDKETGWQTFHWRLNPENALRTLEHTRRKHLEELEHKLRYEEDHQFFVCKDHPRDRLGFEQASEVGFRCPSCDHTLEAEDKKPILQALKWQIESLKKTLAA
jgi:transcription initiation factor TFIIE subunit alpha